MRQDVDDKQAKEITVTVFPPPSSCGGGSSCSCAPAHSPAQDPMEEISHRLREIREAFGDAIQIEVAQYTTLPQLLYAVDRLNSILRTSGKDVVVSASNLGAVLTAVAPIVAVNDKIVAAAFVPTGEQWAGFLKSG